MNIKIFVFSLLTHLAFSFSSDWSSEFDYETYIDENLLFKLYWTDLPDDIIEFGMEVQSTGWIALGISPRGQMPNSDIAIGWVDNNGNVFLQDRHTDSRTAPFYDANQNLTLIEGEEWNGKTRIRFTRPKYTCNDDDLSLSQGTTRLIWAFHATEDPEEECWDSESIKFHTNKGTQSINLDSGVPEEIELENDVTYIDILMDNVAVPAADTTYYCKLFQLPIFNETQHIVKFESLIEAGNEGTVHHIVAYYCPEYLISDPSHIGFEGICDEWDSINMPSTQCRGDRMAFVWAVGGNDIYMPEQAGMPLSGHSEFHYVLLEMHYDNPLEMTNIIDSSGFRMYVTPTLRENDVGVLTIGLNTDTFGQWIPAGLENAHFTGFMTDGCTENTIPSEGIQVFGSLLHQHTIGKAVQLRHIRNDKELPPIDTNFNYDFNYQQTIIFDEHISILAKDEFIIDCWTDSSERTDATIGGESSSQEMCIAILFYYPAIEVTYSLVGKTEDAFKAWLLDAQSEGYLSGDQSDIEFIFNGTNEPDLASLTYYSEKDGALEFYNRLYSIDYDKYNKHTLWCINAGGIVNTDHFNVKIPDGFEEYDMEILSCDGSDDAKAEFVAECVPMNDVSSTTSTTELEEATTEIEENNKGQLIKVYLSIFLSVIVWCVA